MSVCLGLVWLVDTHDRLADCINTQGTGLSIKPQHTLFQTKACLQALNISLLRVFVSPLPRLLQSPNVALKTWENTELRSFIPTLIYCFCFGGISRLFSSSPDKDDIVLTPRKISIKTPFKEY